MGFRVSPEEAREIDALVALSGLTKQDYILRRLTDREVTVYPSVRVQRAVQDQAMLCYEELRELFVLDPRVEPSHTFVYRDRPYWDSHCLNKDVPAIAGAYDAPLLKGMIAFNEARKNQ